MERAVAGLALVLGLLPVLPAGVPVLVTALRGPGRPVGEGRRTGHTTVAKPTDDALVRTVEHRDRDRRDRSIWLDNA